uniref:Uncharacterized protein n=1 Tax=Denticeps clupeoides TaxID=299321 RepID=A0AAY4BKA6_9TELE
QSFWCAARKGVCVCVYGSFIFGPLSLGECICFGTKKVMRTQGTDGDCQVTDVMPPLRKNSHYCPSSSWLSSMHAAVGHGGGRAKEEGDD